MEANTTDHISLLRYRKGLAATAAGFMWAVTLVFVFVSAPVATRLPPFARGVVFAVAAGCAIAALGFSLAWISQAFGLRRLLAAATACHRKNAATIPAEAQGPAEFESMAEALAHGWSFSGELGHYRGEAIPAKASLGTRVWKFAGLRKGHQEQLSENARSFGDLVFVASALQA